MELSCQEIFTSNNIFISFCAAIFKIISVACSFQEELPEWILIENVKDKKYQEFLETQIDWGEASAIALAKEKEDPLLLLDDLKARKLATKLNLMVTGTLGVIHKAKQIGILEKVKPLIAKLQATNFRISENIVEELLRKNNETSMVE